MPFPGSQYYNTIDVAYFINNNIWWLRIVLIIIIISPFLFYMRNGKKWQKILLVITASLYVFIAYEVNFKLLADHMFYQPKEKLFLNPQSDTTAKTKLIIGVAISNEAKAYPIEIIGYHHQIKDTIDGVPIMVTYCTVCRTGRVYSPVVNGRFETFRLVGMDHFNAMFEDATTKSWWRQENGEAITGSLKGTKLKEIISSQMMLKDWLALHPNSLILQPDSNYKARYDSLKGYDEGKIDGSLEHSDTSSWKRKSWVVGVNMNGVSKAYDWNTLLIKRLIEDSITPFYLLITMESNNKTFYVLNRNVNNKVLNFYKSTDTTLTDLQTHSQWTFSGICIAGTLKGTQLQPIQSYQEFWHSWQTFHPATKTYP